MLLFLLTLGLLSLALIGIAIKMFIVKDGEFKKQCAGCVCNSERHEDCQYYTLHHCHPERSEA